MKVCVFFAILFGLLSPVQAADQPDIYALTKDWPKEYQKYREFFLTPEPIATGGFQIFNGDFITQEIHMIDNLPGMDEIYRIGKGFFDGYIQQTLENADAVALRSGVGSPSQTLVESAIVLERSEGNTQKKYTHLEAVNQAREDFRTRYPGMVRPEDDLTLRTEFTRQVSRYELQEKPRSPGGSSGSQAVEEWKETALKQLRKMDERNVQTALEFLQANGIRFRGESIPAERVLSGKAFPQTPNQAQVLLDVTEMDVVRVDPSRSAQSLPDYFLRNRRTGRYHVIRNQVGRPITVNFYANTLNYLWKEATKTRKRDTAIALLEKMQGTSYEIKNLEKGASFF